MIDASIYQNLHTPQIASPLETVGQALAIRNGMQQGAMNQERLKSEQLANRETELKRRDDQIATQTFLQAGGDPDKHVALMAGAGARPQAVQGIQKHYADIIEQKAKTAKDQADADKYANDRLAAITRQALETPDEQYAAAWPQFRAAALQVSPKLQLPEQAPPKPDLQHIGALFTTNEMLDKKAEEARKQAGEGRAVVKAGQEATAAADTHAGAVAKLPDEIARASEAVRQNDAATLAAAIRQSPAAFQAAYSALPADRKSPFAGLTGKEKPEDIAAIGMKPAEQVTTAQTAAHNKATEANAKRLEQIASGRLNVEQEHADIARKVYEQTYGSGANPALAGVEPKLRTQAASAAQKAADEYTKAMESVANMQSFLDLANKGNRAAGSNLPIMGAESIQALNGIRRINRTEIEQYQGAGDLLDRIKGRIGKLAAGQPIPKDVRDDIESLHKTLAENSTKTYEAKRETINQNYRSDFKSVVKPAKTASDAGGAQGGYQVGHLYNNAEYLGGDPNQPGSWKKKH